MENIKKQYVAPVMVKIPMCGDVTMAVPSAHKSMLKPSTSVTIESAYCDDDVEEKTGYTFGETGLE